MCLYLNALHTLLGVSTWKESTGGAVRATKKRRHRATVYTVTRTKRWRNVMPVLYKSVNGFKDFPRASSRTENLLCHQFNQSLLRLMSLFPVNPLRGWLPLFSPAFQNRSITYYRRGWQTERRHCSSIMNINWNRPTNERSATRVIGLITITFLPSAIKRKWTEHVIVIFRLSRTDRYYR